MCLSSPKPPPPPPTVVAPPPPEKAPAELEDAVDSNATALKKKRKGAKQLRRSNNTGTNYVGQSSGGSGLTINK
jgi:hypothetical protein